MKKGKMGFQKSFAALMMALMMALQLGVGALPVAAASGAAPAETAVVTAGEDPASLGEGDAQPADDADNGVGGEDSLPAAEEGADDSTGGDSLVVPAGSSSLAQLIDAATAGNSGTVDNPVEVRVTEDMALEETIRLTGKHIRLVGENNAVIKLQDNNQSNIHVGGTASLTLEDIILDGNSEGNPYNNTALIENTGILRIRDGAVIRNCMGTAIWMQAAPNSEAIELDMTGGEITGNKGNGIYIYSAYGDVEEQVYLLGGRIAGNGDLARDNYDVYSGYDISVVVGGEVTIGEGGNGIYSSKAVQVSADTPLTGNAKVGLMVRHWNFDFQEMVTAPAGINLENYQNYFEVGTHTGYGLVVSESLIALVRSGTENTLACRINMAVGGTVENPVELVLTEDETIEDILMVGELSPRHVLLKSAEGNRHTLKVDSKIYEDAPIYVGRDSSLRLENVVVDGNEAERTDDEIKSIFHLHQTGWLTLGDGAVVQNGRSDYSENAAAVYGQGGLTLLPGSKVINNRVEYGGRTIRVDGRLELLGGEVHSNIQSGWGWDIEAGSRYDEDEEEYFVPAGFELVVAGSPVVGDADNGGIRMEGNTFVLDAPLQAGASLRLGLDGNISGAVPMVDARALSEAEQQAQLPFFRIKGSSPAVIDGFIAAMQDDYTGSLQEKIHKSNGQPGAPETITLNEDTAQGSTLTISKLDGSPAYVRLRGKTAGVQLNKAWPSDTLLTVSSGSELYVENLILAGGKDYYWALVRVAKNATLHLGSGAWVRQVAEDDPSAVANSGSTYIINGRADSIHNMGTLVLGGSAVLGESGTNRGLQHAEYYDEWEDDYVNGAAFISSETPLSRGAAINCYVNPYWHDFDMPIVSGAYGGTMTDAQLEAQAAYFSTAYEHLSPVVREGSIYLANKSLDDLQARLDDAVGSGTPEVIDLTEDVYADQSLRVNGGDITLKSSNGSKIIAQSNSTQILEVFAGHLTLENITLDGNAEKYPKRHDSVVLVNQSGELTLKNGARLTGTSTGGAALTVSMYSTVTMEGGAITGNPTKGAAVDVQGSFTITGGEIKNNGSIDVYRHLDMGTVTVGGTAVIGSAEKGGLQATGYNTLPNAVNGVTISAAAPLTDGASIYLADTGIKYSSFYSGDVRFIPEDTTVNMAAQLPYLHARESYLALETGSDSNGDYIALNNPSQDGLIKALGEAAAGTAETPTNVVLGADVHLTGKVMLPYGKHLRLTGGKSITRENFSGGMMLEIPSGSSLTLADVALVGNRDVDAYLDYFEGGDSQVILGVGGSLVMETGALVTKNAGSCAVFVLHGGTFLMKGGDIKENQSFGGAAGVLCFGDFTMTGGRITGNQATSDAVAGGVYSSGATVITGGEISGNSVKKKSAGTADELYVLNNLTLGGTAKIGTDGAPGGLTVAKGTEITIDTATPLASGAFINMDTGHELSPNNFTVRFTGGTMTGQHVYFHTNKPYYGFATRADETGVELLRRGEQTLRDLIEAADGTAANPTVIELEEDLWLFAPIFLYDEYDVDGDGNETVTGKHILLKSKAGKNVTIHTTAYLNGNAFVVAQNSTLTLESLTMDGSERGKGKEGSLIRSGGTVTLGAGATLKNNTAKVRGGAVENERTGTLTLKNGSVLENNHASDGGGVYNQGTLTLENGAVVRGNDALTGGGVVNLGQMTMSGKDAKITGNAAGQGGGVANFAYGGEEPATFLFTGGQITGNTAAQGAGVLNAMGVFAGAKAVFTMDGADALISGNTIRSADLDTETYPHSYAGGAGVYNGCTYGGATAALGSITANLLKGTIQGNKAEVYDGGGVRNMMGTLIVGKDMEISRNSTEQGRGGGIANTSGAVTLSGTVKDNTSAMEGGGYFSEVLSWAPQASLDFSGATVSGNKAASGAGLFATTGGTINIVGGSIKDNTASYGGGGIYVTNGAVVNMRDAEGLPAEISGNSATKTGGGITVDGTFNMYGGRIAGNTALEGGGIFNYGKVALQDGAVVAGNTASGSAGHEIYNGVGREVKVAGLVQLGLSNGVGGYYAADGSASPIIVAGKLAQGAVIMVELDKNTENGRLVATGGAGYTMTQADADRFACYGGTQLNFDASSGKLRFGTVSLLHRVAFDLNGGTGTLPAAREELATGSLITLPGMAAVGQGLTFLGWNTQPDGTGTSHRPGDRLSVTESLLLYAQWRGASYPITYLGLPESSTQTHTNPAFHTFGITTQLAPPLVCQPGKVFAGWQDASGGIVTAIGYKVNQAVSLTATWQDRPDYVAPTAVTLNRSVCRFVAGGDSASLTVSVQPANAVQEVYWHSSNTRVATVDAGGRVTPVAPGSATVTAHSVDGGSIFASCTINVTANAAGVRRTEQISLAGSLQVYTGDDLELPLATGSEPGMEIVYQTIQSGDRISPDSSVISVEGGRLKVTGAAGSKGILRAWWQQDPTVSADCLVEVIKVPDLEKTDLKLTQYRLDPATLAMNTMSLSPGVLQLWLDEPKAGEEVVPLTGFSFTFASGKSAPKEADLADVKTLNELFELVPVSGREVEVRVRAGVTDAQLKALGKSYSLKIEMQATGTTGEQGAMTVSRVLTFKPSFTAPALAAEDISINSFLTDGHHGVILKGTVPVKLELDGTKERQNAKLLGGSNPWLSFDKETGTVSSSLAKGKKSGVLYLLATLNAEEYRATDPVPVKVKVSASYNAPALKLSATSVSFIASAELSRGIQLSLLPKNSGDTLQDLGVEQLELVPWAEVRAEGKEKTYKLNNTDQYGYQLYYDAETGAVNILTEDGRVPAPGKLWLQARIAGGGPVRLALTVKTVKAGTRISLKAEKTSTTLNPGQNDSVALAISPSIDGFDLDYTTLSEPLWLNSKAKPLAAGITPPQARMEGGRLVITTVKGETSEKQTFKLRLTAPGANAHVGGKGSPDATLTLTVKTTDGGKATALLKVKGSANLTTGAAATATITFTGTTATYDKDDVFTVTGPTGQDATKQFRFERTGPGAWRIGPDSAASLAPGEYTLSAKGAAGNAGEISSNTAKLNVKATKPRLVQSAKSVTLRGNTLSSSATLVLSTAEGNAPIRDIKPAGGEHASFKVTYLSGGLCLITFKDDAARASAKTGSIKLNIFLEGNSNNAKPVATATVKVVVQKLQ
ncbi:Ig-like domain-containing protein [Ruminococcaceae bacterium OttesenSCG-928-D13]|nr:Ig-like domain-containing protein [Ruminococcaceae bacterium OttesenSCG-928-D13]